MSNPVLVTGVAGFIGFHVAKRLLADGRAVVGLDVVNSYYDPQLKRARLAQLADMPNYEFLELDLGDRDAMRRTFSERRPPQVVHLAAQAGVRYSIENPSAYIDSNIVGFQHILDGCREVGVQHLLYASSSSVYGANRAMPFSEHHGVNHPLSLYAATKRANELQAHAYSHLFRLPTTGLRFFTVYGPWGRPDMALFLFTKAVLEGRPIDVFNAGKMQRDFTYIDDIVESIVRLLDKPPAPNPEWNPESPDPATSSAPFRVYNIGNSAPVELERMIAAVEASLGKKAIRNDLPMQPGDVLATHADTAELEATVDFRPQTTIEEGVRRFVAWYRDYYRV